MKCTIIGLTEKGSLTIHDRSVSGPPSAERLEDICRNYRYVQVLVSEDRFAGYCKLYEYDEQPRLREIPV